MVSPWLPRVIASTSRMSAPAASAMKWAKRALSRFPAWPMTRSRGKPDTSAASVVMWSRGLVTTISTASGEVSATRAAIAGHDAGVGRQQVHAAHARLARQAGGEQHHVAARGLLVVVGADHPGGVALQVAGLVHVEGQALGQALHHVGDDHLVDQAHLGEALGGRRPVPAGARPRLPWTCSSLRPTAGREGSPRLPV